MSPIAVNRHYGYLDPEIWSFTAPFDQKISRSIRKGRRQTNRFWTRSNCCIYYVTHSSVNLHHTELPNFSSKRLKWIQPVLSFLLFSSVVILDSYCYPCVNVIIFPSLAVVVAMKLTKQRTCRQCYFCIILQKFSFSISLFFSLSSVCIVWRSRVVTLMDSIRPIMKRK